MKVKKQTEKMSYEIMVDAFNGPTFLTKQTKFVDTMSINTLNLKEKETLLDISLWPQNFFTFKTIKIKETSKLIWLIFL